MQTISITLHSSSLDWFGHLQAIQICIKKYKALYEMKLNVIHN